MKQFYFLLTVLFFTNSAVFSQTTTIEGPARFTFPIERMVFQRNSNDQADVSITGQYGYGLFNQTLYYSVLNLDTEEGLPNSNFYTGIVQLPYISTDVSISVKRFRLNYPALAKGWYQATIYAKVNGQYQSIANVKFGVGDVYIIAGQSNARGYEDTYDGGLIGYYNKGDITLPDAVNVINAYAQSGEIGTTHMQYTSYADEEEIVKGGLPFKQRFSKLDFKMTTPFITTDKNTNVKSNLNFPIYPVGPESWAYSILGYNLIKGTNAPKVPVLFFNTATGGQPVHSWIDNNYNTYQRFQATLLNFGTILGARAILWHQGEADNQIGTNPSNYATDLGTVINNSRNYLPNVPWFISQVSYNYAANSQTSTALTTMQAALVAPNFYSPNKPFLYQGIATDDLPYVVSSDNNATNRGVGYKVHFHAYAHKTTGERWFNAINANIAQATPVPSKALIPMAVSNNNNGTYRLSIPSNSVAAGAKFYWVKNNDGWELALNSNTAQDWFDVPANTGSNVDTYTCYISTSAGTQFQVANPFVAPNNVDGVQALLANGTTNVITVPVGNTVSQTNNVLVSSTNVLWQVNNLPSWISLNTLQGGFGNTQLVITTTQSNNSNNARTASFIVGENPSDPNNPNNRTITVTQTGISGGCQMYLSDMSTSYQYQDFGTLNKDLSVDGTPMMISGQTFSKGLGTHAYSDIQYNLAGQYITFQASIGRDDEADGCGTYCGTGQTIVFKVKADGVLLYTSPSMGVSTSAIPISIDVTNRNTLQLIVEDGGDVTYGDHADWADAKVLCATNTNPCNSNMVLSGVVSTGTYKSSDTIINNGSVNTGNNVANQATRFISLTPPFKADNGSVFKAEIKPCN